MRVFACMLMMAVLTSTSTGCALFGKKTGSGDRAPLFGGDANKPPPKFPTGDPLLTTPGTVPPPVPVTPTMSAAPTDQAILAGHVVDPLNRPPGNTWIRLVRLDSKQANEKQEEIDVRVDGSGYFTIPGLRPGATYKLITRTADRKLARIDYVQAPNIRLAIQVREDLASPDTPAVPDAKAAAPVSSETKEAPQKTSDLGKQPTATTWQSDGKARASGGTVKADVQPVVPVPAQVPTPQFKPEVARTPSEQPFTPPTLSIPSKQRATPAPQTPFKQEPKAPPVPTPGDASLKVPMRVPTCNLLGQQLVALALNDTKDQTWNFQDNRQRKLLLLDFWSVGCVPCKQSLKKLAKLQYDYGHHGLEVVGVVMDRQSGIAQQVNKVCADHGATNYRQLLADDQLTNISGQFRIASWPTMVLIDESGQIVWSSQSGNLPALEHQLQQRLLKRVF